MAEPSAETLAPTVEDLREMHELYRRGGQERRMAPHIVYSEVSCPHLGCGQPMQAIDFRLEDHGRLVYDPLVRAGGTIRGSRAAAPIVVDGSISRFATRGRPRPKTPPYSPNSPTTGTVRRRSCDYPSPRSHSRVQWPMTDRSDLDLILASTSPYRRELLGRLGVPFRSLAPGVDRGRVQGRIPATRATWPCDLALAKATALAADHPDATLIGSDQVVAFDGTDPRQAGDGRECGRATAGDGRAVARVDHGDGGLASGGRPRRTRM